MSDLPSQEELGRLLQLHALRLRRGPIIGDPLAVQKLRRKIDKMPARYRFIIRCGDPADMSALELSATIALVVKNGATVRRYRGCVSIESTHTIPSDNVARCRSIAADLKKIVDQKCPVCQSLMLQIKGCEDVPGWAVSCRECVNVLPGPDL